ncbi:MAG: ribosome maturation factor RimP [Candidatus Hydrogenedentes bacterium]|nr:ribosome maturation factor RimP [Candidatus Hydrogenedentota bacterium]
MEPRNDIVQRAWSVLEPELAVHGYELVEVEFEPSGRRTLRLYIDRDGGVTVDDCVAVSQLAGPVLDVKDFIDGSYVLEVSSPGIDRPVRKPADFARFTGERIHLKTHVAVHGRKRFTGVLTGFEDGLVRIDCDGTVCEVHIENLKRANLDR